MVIRHRHTPVSHGALRIGLRDIEESFLRCGIGEGMQESHTLIEAALNGGQTGHGKKRLTELLWCRMIMFFLAQSWDHAHGNRGH
jgi:hypothetical protein